MAAGILGSNRFGNFRMLQAISRCLLNGDELTGIIVVLHIAECLDYQRVTGYESDSPAGHVVRLGQGVQLYADILGTRYGQEAERLHTVIS
ncbi:hypothetical protein D3C74_332600 [compost metagenome]